MWGVLLAGLLVSAPRARAEPRALYVAAIADYSGKGSGRALHDQIEAALQAKGVLLATPASLEELARQAGVGLDRSPSDEAAARLAFQVPLAGVLILRAAKRHEIAVVLIDGQGQHLLSSSLHTAHAPSGEELSVLAEQVASALRAGLAPEAVPAPIAAPAPRPPNPALIPLLRAALAPALATRTYSLPGLFTYQSDSPYGAVAVSAELFPLDDPALHGLGLLFDLQYGIAKAQIGAEPSFQQTDFRIDFAFAYRFIPVEGPFGPAVQGAASVGHRAFDAPASSGIANDDRTYFGLGVAIDQPVVPHLLRAELSFTWMPAANATVPVALQQTYATSSGTGIEWSAGVIGLPLGPIEFVLRVDQQRFTDSYPASEGQQGATGKDVFTTYLLAIQYHLD